MNNKSKIIIGMLVGIIVLLFISILPYINNTQKTNSSDQTINKPTDSKINSKDNYYIEEGFSTIAKSVKFGIENYAAESVNESVNERNIRLSRYFTSDSSVYSQTTQYVGGNITKTTAKLTSLSGCADQESDNICANAKIDLTSYYKDRSENTQSVTYYMFIKSTGRNEYKIVDIGPWDI